jgi:UDP-glucose 4-epimerase
MKIAVTGGSGNIGRAVIEMALAQGHRVVSIDRAPPSQDAAIRQRNKNSSARDEPQPNVTFIEADITNYAAFENALRGCDALVHLAAIASPKGYPDYEVHNNNIVGSYNALSAAARLGIDRVCQASSINAIGAAYSRVPRYDYFPVDEEHPTYNEDPYSLSKWICEQQADSFARRYENMSIASLRFHWVVSDRAFAVEHKEDSGESPPKHLWGYTRYDAVARACLLSLTANFKGHEVFFIVAPDTLMDVPSLELAREFYPDVPIRGDLSGNQSFFNSTKAERLLDWKHGA